MNLLNETIEVMKENDLDSWDVMFIGSEYSGHCCTWEEFKTLADYEYDNGFGSPKVAEDLIIVFNCGSKMTRDEYDGSEWWDVHKPFNKPESTQYIRKLFADGIGWETLEKINGVQV